MKYSFHSYCLKNLSKPEDQIFTSRSVRTSLFKNTHYNNKLYFERSNSSNRLTYTEIRESSPSFTSISVAHLAQKSRRSMYYEKRTSNKFFYRVLLTHPRLNLSNLPTALKKTHQIAYQNL